MLAQVLKRVGQIELQEMPVPVPAAGEVVVRVRSALTCGTDLKTYLRGHPKWPTPTRFGHEFSGEIAAVGGGVDKCFKPGDAVMCAPTAPCNECFYCNKGLENLCQTCMDKFVLGAFGEYLVIPEHIVKQNLYHKPDHLPFDQAALLEPLACVVYGLEQIPIEKGDRVIVIGTGPIAAMFMMLAKDAGADKIIAIGRRAYRLEQARKFGADACLSALDPVSLEAGINENTGGHGADKVIECTGQVDVWQKCLDYLRMGGSALLYGGCTSGTEVTWDTGLIHYGQLTLKGAFHYTPGAVKKAYNLLCQARLPFAELITDTFELRALEAALQRFKEGECMKLAMRNNNEDRTL